jgi:hypothetical protein
MIGYDRHWSLLGSNTWSKMIGLFIRPKKTQGSWFVICHPVHWYTAAGNRHLGCISTLAMPMRRWSLAWVWERNQQGLWVWGFFSGCIRCHLGAKLVGCLNGNWGNFDMAVCPHLVRLVNIKIAGKWMFIPLKMVLIGIDPSPYVSNVPHGFPTLRLEQENQPWDRGEHRWTRMASLKDHCGSSWG